MAILNDYRCTTCFVVQECWTSSPAPDELGCGSCGAPARRLFAAVGLSSGALLPPTSSGSRSGGPSLCQEFPQVPGLCHMSESAGRMMVARYQRDNRRIEHELARQEAAAAVRTPSMDDVITHNHHAVAPAAKVAEPVGV
jgi:hypothetical protein